MATSETLYLPPYSTHKYCLICVQSVNESQTFAFMPDAIFIDCRYLYQGKENYELFAGRLKLFWQYPPLIKEDALLSEQLFHECSLQAKWHCQ